MKARYEKVDEKTIRFIIEKPTEVTIAHLLANKKELIAQRNQLDKTISSIDEILDNARILGIDVNEQTDTPTTENKDEKLS